MKMKKILVSLVLWISFISFASALSLSDALKDSDKLLKQVETLVIEWNEDEIISSLHEKWITIHDTWEAFNPTRSIRRDEAAKMLTLAVKYLPSTSKLSKWKGVSCTFSDSSKAWDDLRDIIVESCEKGLFKWSNGNFNPQNSITYAQVFTVLWRMLYWMQDESKGHYASEYVKLLVNDWYLDESFSSQSLWNKDANRWDIAKLLVKVIE